MADRSISININVSSSGAVEGVNDVEGATRSLEVEGGESVQSFGNTMQVALGNIAAVAAEQLAAQMQVLISQGRELVQRGAEISETQQRFNEVFGESRDVVQAFIEDQAQMMGLSEARAQELIATAGSIAQSAGVAKEESAQMSVRVAQLAGDVASFNDANPEEIFDAISSGLLGGAEELEQYGIAVDEQMVQQKALAMTGKEAADALTQQERAVAGLELMYEKAGPQLGAMERRTDSAASAGRQAAAAWADVRNELAEQLVPVAAEVNQELLELAESEEVMETVRTAALELSEQLVTGVRLASDFVQVFADNREEIKTGAEVIGLLAAGVTSYVAATKAQVLWTNRAIIAQKAAAVAQRGLNAVMRANPVGLIVSALAIVLPLIWRFRGAIMEAAASVLEFSADSIRGLQGVVDWFEKIASRIPDALATGPLAVFKAGVQGLDQAVDTSADTMDDWAESLRETAKESDDATVSLEEQEEVVTDETEAMKENTEAHRENAEARDEAASAGGEVSTSPMEPADPVEIDTEVSAPNELAEVGPINPSTFMQAEEALDSALRNLAGSGDEVDAALKAVNDELEKTSDPEKRASLQALRAELQRAQKAASIVDRGLSNMNRSAKQAAVEGFVQLGKAIGDASMSMADFGRAAQQIMSDLAATLGKQLITIGTSLVFIPGFQGQGAAYIAAGTTLTALSAAIAPSSPGGGGGSGGGRRQEEGPSDARVPSFQEGVTNFEGGLARVHEEELLVNMPPGTDVVPKGSQLPLSKGIKQQAGGAGQGVEQKLDEVAKRFEEKQFRLRGRDQVTQQERTQAVYDDAGIK